MRQDPATARALVLGMEGTGVIILSVAGWLGGTMVYRNQVGVDIRYANAGKWNEENLGQANGPTEVAKTSELQVNQMKLVRIDGKRIVIGRTEKGYVAFDDHCTHRGGSLAGGSMICGTVQCPWHGSQFDVNTGDVRCGPARKKIKNYAVIEKSGKVYLEL
jgi:nitrite reductase/ring-hydroxylating ferredoxin subunit